jgi:hypothetical protein
MSDLSEVLHGHISLGAFLSKEANHVRSVIGNEIVDDALEGAADQIEVVQAVISRTLHAYLDSKGLAGKAAAAILDGWLHGLAGALEAAAKGAESK